MFGNDFYQLSWSAMSHALLSLYLFVILRYGIINSEWWRDKEMHKLDHFILRKPDK